MKDLEEKGCVNCIYTSNKEDEYPCLICRRAVIVGTDEYCERSDMWSNEEKDNDLVIHPNHYNIMGRKECWEEMKELFGDEAVAIFDILSAYKYYYRAGNKDGNSEEQDMAKIDNYMRHCADLVVVSNDRNMTLPRKCYRVMKKVLNETL